MADTEAQVGAPISEDEGEVRRPMHVKRGEPGSEVEGDVKFRELSPDEKRPSQTSRRASKK